MRSANKVVEIRFYNKKLERTHDASEAFERTEDTLLTRFVLTYCFSVRKEVLTVSLSRVVFHFFHPGALLSHIDYIVNVLQKKNGSDKLIRLKEVSKEERQSIVEVLLATVIGGGVAGSENGMVATTWYSGSIKDELGCMNPKVPNPQFFQECLKRRLDGIIGSQT